MTTAEYNW